MRLYSVFIFFFIPLIHFAQDCGCDYTVGMDVDYLDGAAFEPGDVICISSGLRLQLRLENMEGTAENPIRIINCGGQVIINAPYANHGLEIVNSRHFIIDGTGSDVHEYGFKFMNTNESGIHLEDLSRFFSMHHIEISGVDGPAVLLRDEPRCDLTANEGFYIGEEMTFSHFFIHDGKDGFRIGHPQFHLGAWNEDCEMLFPYELKGLEISHSRIEGLTAGNGITAYGAGGHIHHVEMDEIHGDGICTGTRSNIVFESNRISNTYLYGIKAKGYSTHEIRNNVFAENSGVGMGSVWVEFYSPVGGGLYDNSLDFRHNTSVGSGSYNLKIDNPAGASEVCRIENNLLAESMVLEPYWSSFGPHFNFEATDLIQVNNNFYAENRSLIEFVDGEAGNFELTHSSPVINDGLVSGISQDFTGQIRNLAGAPDLGAYEYVPESISNFDEIGLVGLYVNDFKYILGDVEAETNLLDFAVENGFNYLLFYNLDYIHYNICSLDDEFESTLLADFIERAKAEYGMVQVGAVGETNASFDKVETFNSFNENNWFRTFDVLNMEFEFWTENEGLMDYYCDAYLIDAGVTCTHEGAYEFYEAQLEAIDERAHDMGIISEIYIGYPTDEECTALAERTDRMLMHYYRTSDTYGDGSSIYQYHPYRIQAIALSERMPAVMPIFSSRSYHMGPWLLDHSLHQPMDTWVNGIEGYLEDDSEGVADLPLAGYQWYRYTSFLDIYDLDAPSIMAPLTDTTGNGLQMAYFPQSNEIMISRDEPTYKSGGEMGLLSIYDITGQLKYTYTINDLNSVRIPLENLNSGVYISQLTANGKCLSTKKIAVVH